MGRVAMTGLSMIRFGIFQQAPVELYLGSPVQKIAGIKPSSGGMAQLVARLHGMQKVRGSNPLTSTD